MWFLLLSSEIYAWIEGIYYLAADVKFRSLTWETPSQHSISPSPSLSRNSCQNLKIKNLTRHYGGNSHTGCQLSNPISYLDLFEFLWNVNSKDRKDEDNWNVLPWNNPIRETFFPFFWNWYYIISIFWGLRVLKIDISYAL